MRPLTPTLFGMQVLAAVASHCGEVRSCKLAYCDLSDRGLQALAEHGLSLQGEP